MRPIFPLLSLLLLGLPLRAGAHELAACEKIHRVYSACGERFRYREGFFRFPVNGTFVDLPCHDRRELDFYDRIDDMDVASILSIPYQSGPVPLPEVRRNWDPGRLRAEPLLMSVFGGNESAVRARLVPVSFLGQTIKFQRQLGAAAALARVSEDLLAEARRDPGLAAFLEPFTAKRIDLRLYGFSWRFVKGTTRLSTHSFGTGIDLLLPEGPQYWLWDEMRRNPERARLGESAYRDLHFVPAAAPRFHPKAVEIFERHGFIWGGKWNHYDTMHFEYRPEFFASDRLDCSGDRIPIVFQEPFTMQQRWPLEEEYAPELLLPLEADH